MAFLNFKARGGAARALQNFPFEIILENVQSGISSAAFNGKAPCDTGTQNYLSPFEYKTVKDYPSVNTSGKVSFKIFSGSKLFAQPTFFDSSAPVSGIKTSYQGDLNQFVIKNDCTGVLKEPLMTIYGLNRSIFLDGFLANASETDSLKIWLGVAFPVGDPNPIYNSPMSSFQSYATGECSDCTKRANIPMSAFIGVNMGDWLPSVEARLIDKSTNPLKPRYERRQVLSRVPIGEINKSGVVTQYSDSNLTLTDMCLQGIPCKMPLSTFCEFR